MTSSPSNGLVSAEWLAANLGKPGIVVLDATWTAKGTVPTGNDLFAEKHIPGARRYDIDKISNKASSLPHMLPTPEQFAAEAGMLGIGVGTPLVVRAGRRQLTVPFTDTFAAVAPGEIVAFTDSAGLISLAVNAGDAAQELGLPPGAHVRLSLARQP